MRDTTEEPRTPISASSAMSMGGRRVPLPAVKGTMGGIESPRRELFSPASTQLQQHAQAQAAVNPATLRQKTQKQKHEKQMQKKKTQLRASTSPASSTHGDSTTTVTAAPNAKDAPPALIFRADPRMTTAFDGMPEGADAIKAKFGV